MKKYINKIMVFALVLTLASGLYSCSDLVDGYERSPNLPINADAAQMVQAMQLSLNVGHQGEMARLTGIWSGYFTGADRQYIAYEDYALTSASFNGAWGELYSGTIFNAKVMAEKAKATGNNQLAGMGKVCQAMSYGTLASLFGDIPMTEAGDVEQFGNPKYDGQVAVYGQIQGLLDEAITDLSSAGSIPNDLYYGGDASLWIELAHSLKARYYMMTKEYAKVISEAVQGISNSDNDFMGNTQEDFAFTVRDWNLFFQFSWWDREGYMTAEKAYLPTLLDVGNANYRGDAKSNEAARYDFYYLAPGDYSALDHNYYGFFGPTQSNPMVSFVEMQLSTAEAYSRTSDDANALIALNLVRVANDSLYEAADSTFVPYEMADFEAGGMANIAGKSAGASLQMEILEERYVSLYGSIEVFVDLNRTNNQLAIPSRNTKDIPKRFLYPQSEVNANTNFPGIVDFNTPTPVNK